MSGQQPPRFTNVSCSNCGDDFGPGNEGFSHCDQHGGRSLSDRYLGHEITWNEYRERTEHAQEAEDRAAIAKATGERS